MWKQVEFLYLSHDEVYELRPSFKDIVGLIEICFKDKMRGEADMPPKIAVSPRDEVYIHAKPGYLASLNVAGIKWQSNVMDNPSRGLPNNIGLVILTDPVNGATRAVMDCTWVTALRTPAASMTAIKYLGPSRARVGTIIGLGLQGRCHFDALIETRVVPELETIKVYDLKEEAIASFVEYAAGKSGLTIEPCESPEAAIRNSDIIITCTQFLRRSDPVVRPDWVKRGSLALPAELGSYWTPEARESMDKIFTDDIAQTNSFAARGFFQGESVRLDAELGAVITGETAGRTSDEQKLMCINGGLSLYDIALAQRIYERAVSNKVGTWLRW